MAYSARPETEKIGILVSMKIRPYLQALDGVKEVLSQMPDKQIYIFYLDDVSSKNKEVFIEKLQSESISHWIAVGPEAAAMVWKEFSGKSIPNVFTMVLNPEKLVDPGDTMCGISLNIPVSTQLERIGYAVPEVRSIGLLYDRKNNATFAKQAIWASMQYGLKIIPMEIESREDLSTVLKSNWQSIDALWLIPDYTVITESIVRFIIKEALIHDKPVIGFNRFFYQSGAAISFVTDYEKTGEKTATLFQKILQQSLECDVEPPEFDVWLNPRVLKKLNIRFAEDEFINIKEGP